MQGSNTITRIVCYSPYQPEWLKWLEACLSACPNALGTKYQTDRLIWQLSIKYLHAFFNPSTNITSFRKASISCSILLLPWPWIIKNTSQGKNTQKQPPKTILRNLWQLSYMHTFSCKMCTFPVVVLCQRCVQCSYIKSLKLSD